MASVSMFKHRYTFTDEGSGLKWEVDAVPDGNGGYYPWVRAEIEVKDLKDKVPEFPIKTEEIIYPPELSETSEEEYKEKTDKLNSRFFVKGNVYLDDDKAQNNTELKGDADKVVETKPESEEETPDATQADANEADKEKDAKASLSVDNITDDKDKAEKVETRGEQIKEAREEVEGPGEDSGDDEEAATDTEETDSGEEGDSEGESKGDEESNKDEDSGEEDKGDKEGGEEPGWDEPAKDDKEVSKESFDNYGKNYDTNGQVDINGIVEVSTETEEQPTGIADETFNFITSEISQEMRK